ncbi:hypothetical protein BCR43DRAFT_482296 [Syncephalastrum racemosum]|uniref:DNA endonuclease activator Ctp1 C-terminal domain-containing protein n=1 Tax=Syncephalastrum racemosum TaxID=13706 RepID=A0A1X2HTP7_SYNRA|nr:hypothetical protein BCR43DRAFT_482296 [Syncephalastrum racemosum]
MRVEEKYALLRERFQDKELTIKLQNKIIADRERDIAQRDAEIRERDATIRRLESEQKEQLKAKDALLAEKEKQCKELLEQLGLLQAKLLAFCASDDDKTDDGLDSPSLHLDTRHSNTTKGALTHEKSPTTPLPKVSDEDVSLLAEELSHTSPFERPPRRLEPLTVARSPMGRDHPLPLSPSRLRHGQSTTAVSNTLHRRLPIMDNGEGSSTGRASTSRTAAPEYTPHETPCVEVVRKKCDRAKLPGSTCACCDTYYKQQVTGPDGEGGVITAEGRVQMTSRHRERFKRPLTPPGFWDMDMPSTPEILSKSKKMRDQRIKK